MDQIGFYQKCFRQAWWLEQTAVFLYQAVVELYVIDDDLDGAVEGVGVVRTKFRGLRLFYNVHDSVGVRQVSFDAVLCAYRRIMS